MLGESQKSLVSPIFYYEGCIETVTRQGLRSVSPFPISILPAAKIEMGKNDEGCLVRFANEAGPQNG